MQLEEQNTKYAYSSLKRNSHSKIKLTLDNKTKKKKGI